MCWLKILEIRKRSSKYSRDLCISCRGRYSSQTFHHGDSSDAYRIDDAAEEYIANFKTVKGLAAEYAVEVWRTNTDWMVGKFLFKTVK